MKKKLLFIGSYPPPYGGISTHLYDILPMLERSGYEIYSITTSLTNKIIKSQGMTNVFFNSRKYFLKNIFINLMIFILSIKARKDLIWRELLRVIPFYIFVKKFIINHGINAVFIYSIDNAFIIPFLKKNIPESTPIILMIFGAFYLNPQKYIKKSSYVEDIFKNCDMITSSSQYCGESLARVLSLHYPVKTIYIGVNDHIYKPNNNVKIREELNIPSSAVVLLFLGRMTKSMGVDFLLENAKYILGIDPNIYLILAGAKGDLSLQVKELAKMEDRIRYCEDIPFDKKPDFYASCDIYLAPTMEKHACMGVSIKEAMAMGRAVITSTSGGIPEAVKNGDNGFLIGIRDGNLDKDAFLKHVSILVNDLSLRYKMGNRGREKAVSIFSNDQTYKRYTEILKRFAL